MTAQNKTARRRPVGYRLSMTLDCGMIVTTVITVTATRAKQLPDIRIITLRCPQQQFEAFMSFEAMGWAINEDTGNPQSKLILLILASMADEHGKCWPSHNYIADRACLGKRSVINHLNALESTHRLFVDRRFNERGKTSNMYTVCFQPYILQQAQKGLVQNMHMGGAANALPPSAADAHETITLSKQSVKHSYSNEFERWWIYYPKKVGKKKAFAVWNRIKPDANTLIDDTINRIESDGKWLKGFILDPERYLSGERWNDELQTRNGTGNEPLSPADEYSARVERENEIISKLNGSHVADNGEAVSPAMDEKQWGDRQHGIPRLDG